MQRQLLALALIITGLVLGIIGNIVFYAQSLGLSVPLFVTILLVVVIFWAWRQKIRLSLRKIWLILPIIFFASMFVIRANPILLLLDGIALVSLSALFLYYLNHDIHADNASSQDHIMALFESTGNSLTGAGGEISHSWQWLSNRKWSGLSPFVAVGRGLLITIPIIIVFAILFSSADAIFSERVDNLLSMVSFDNLEIFGTRFLLVLAIAWLSIGLLSHGLTKRSLAEDTEPFDADYVPDTLSKQSPLKFTLGMTETSIILGSVVLLFAFFVFIQLTYFFAGEVAIAEGMTYSEYARRGFFELLAVSIIVLALILVLDHVSIRKRVLQHSIFLSLSVIIVALTLVIMLSAWQRMGLYEEAYGFTYLRVFSHVFIVWLAVLLAFALIHIFRVRANIFAFGAILVAIGYLGTLNLMNLDYYIAEQNIARYYDGEELDLCYLRQLSVDALPALLDLYTTADDETIQNDLAAWFALQKRQETERYADSTIFEFNLAHQSAWQVLENMRFDTSNASYCSYRSF